MTADPVTAAIESSVASAFGGSEEGTTEPSEDTSTDSGESTSPDDATADTGSTGEETGEAEAESEGTGEADETEADASAEHTEEPSEKPKGKRKVMPWNEHDKTLKKVRKEYEDKIAGLTKDLEATSWARDYGHEEVQARIRALDLAEADPDKFAEIIVQDTKLAQGFRKALGLTKAEAKEVAAGTAEATGDEPKPNQVVHTDDGDVEYYDNKGVAELVKWHVNRALNQERESHKRELDERIGPIEKRAQAEAVWNDALVRNNRKLEHARANWKGFKELEPKIQERFLSDKKLTLEDAYRLVRDEDVDRQLKELTGKAQTSRDALRKELLAEINGKASATADRVEDAPAGSVGGGTGDAVTAAIRGAMRKAGLK